MPPEKEDDHDETEHVKDLKALLARAAAALETPADLDEEARNHLIEDLRVAEKYETRTGIGRLTPLEIETLLRCYWSPEPPRDAPAVRNAIGRFTRCGWIQPADGGCYEITAEGRHRVERILHIFDEPIPQPTRTTTRVTEGVHEDADVRRHEFPTSAEAVAFLEGIEFVSDPTVEARIEDAEPNVVITEDNSEVADEEE